LKKDPNDGWILCRDSVLKVLWLTVTALDRPAIRAANCPPAIRLSAYSTGSFLELLISQLEGLHPLIIEPILPTYIKPSFLCHRHSNIKVCSVFELMLKSCINLDWLQEG